MNCGNCHESRFVLANGNCQACGYHNKPKDRK
jgi:ribosomal protein L37E